MKTVGKAGNGRKARRGWRGWALGLALAAMAAALAGCGDNHVLNERALALVMGVEPAGQGGLAVELQLPSPQGLSTLGPGEGAAGGGRGPNFWLLRGSGPTLSAALADAQGRTSQDLYLGQLQAIILSTRLSPAAFSQVLSSLARIGTLDQTTYVLLSPAPLKRLLALAPAPSTLPGLYFATLFSCRRCQTVDVARQLWSLEKRSLTPLAAAWVPVVTPAGAALAIDRVGLVRPGQPPHLLSRSQSQLLGLLLSRTSKVAWTLKTRQGVVGIRALQASTRFRPRWQGGRLTIAVRIHATGLLADYPLARPARSAVSGLERQMASSLAERATGLLGALSGQGLDPFDLGPAFLWQHPAAARRWATAYEHARWRVRASVTLQRYGDAT